MAISESEKETKNTEIINILDILMADLSGKDIKQYAGRIVVGPDEDTRFGRIGSSPGVFVDKVSTGKYRVAIPSMGTFDLYRYNLENNISSFEADIVDSINAKSWVVRTSAIRGDGLIVDDEFFNLLLDAMISQGQTDALAREGFTL